MDYTISVIAVTGLSRPVTTIIPFTLRAQNPCHETSGVPASELPFWCPSGDWDLEMPPWMKKIKDLTVYIGDSLDHDFEPANRFDAPLNVTIDLGSASRFADYDLEKDTLRVHMAKLEDEGYWRIIILAEETSNTGKIYYWTK